MAAERSRSQRHGLEADGIIGAGTRAALSVPLTDRVRQVELALERLRWLPHLDRERFLAVNIPMFRLWLWDSIPASGAPSFGMNVIVGRSLNRQTPVFVEQMDYIVFRPYWNVPSSIVRSEILPPSHVIPLTLNAMTWRLRRAKATTATSCRQRRTPSRSFGKADYACDSAQDHETRLAP